MELEAAGGGAALSPKRVALVALSAAIAGGRGERIVARLAEAEGRAGAEAVEEAVLQSYLFVGYPAALNALALWRQRYPEVAAADEDAAPGAWRSRGEAVCRQVYANAYAGLRGNVARLHPEMERWMLAEGYGKVLGREGLDLATREVCIVGLLAAQDAPRQLHSHLRGCLNVGLTPDEVAEALEVALAEAAANPPPSLAERAERQRMVWSRVRERHEEKAMNEQEDHGEDV